MRLFRRLPRELRVFVPRCETLAHAYILAAAPIVAIPGVCIPRVEAGPAFNEVFAIPFIVRAECIVARAPFELIDVTLSQLAVQECIRSPTAVDAVGATIALDSVVAVPSSECVGTVSAFDMVVTIVAYHGDRPSYPPTITSIANIDASNKTTLLVPSFILNSLR